METNTFFKELYGVIILGNAPYLRARIRYTCVNKFDFGMMILSSGTCGIVFKSSSARGHIVSANAVQRNPREVPCDFT